jgi:hypothetical protein
MIDLTEGVGLDIVLRLQDAHNPFFDALARILHFAGGTTFYLIVIPLVFWSIDRRLGLRILVAFIISGVAVVWLKEIFQQPRPYQVAPDKINKLFDQSGYGFPSGHVMQDILIWGMVVLYLSKRRALWGVGVLAILTGWSRMYGGVHYPQDVIGGFIVGALLLWIFEPLYTSLTHIASRMPLRANLASIFMIGFVIFIFSYNDPYGVAIAGITWGAGFGLIVEERYFPFTTHANPSQRILSYVGGIILISVIYNGFGGLVLDKTQPTLWDIVVFTLIGFTATAGWVWIALRLDLMRPANETAVSHTLRME